MRANVAKFVAISVILSSIAIIVTPEARAAPGTITPTTVERDILGQLGSLDGSDQGGTHYPRGNCGSAVTVAPTLNANTAYMMRALMTNGAAASAQITGNFGAGNAFLFIVQGNGIVTNLNAHVTNLQFFSTSYNHSAQDWTAFDAMFTFTLDAQATAIQFNSGNGDSFAQCDGYANYNRNNYYEIGFDCGRSGGGSPQADCWDNIGCGCSATGVRGDNQGVGHSKLYADSSRLSESSWNAALNVGVSGGTVNNGPTAQPLPAATFARINPSKEQKNNNNTNHASGVAANEVLAESVTVPGATTFDRAFFGVVSSSDQMGTEYGIANALTKAAFDTGPHVQLTGTCQPTNIDFRNQQLSVGAGSCTPTWLGPHFQNVGTGPVVVFIRTNSTPTADTFQDNTADVLAGAQEYRCTSAGTSCSAIGVQDLVFGASGYGASTLTWNYQASSRDAAGAQYAVIMAQFWAVDSLRGLYGPNLCAAINECNGPTFQLFGSAGSSSALTTFGQQLYPRVFNSNSPVSGLTQVVQMWRIGYLGTSGKEYAGSDLFTITLQSGTAVAAEFFVATVTQPSISPSGINGAWTQANATATGDPTGTIANFNFLNVFSLDEYASTVNIFVGNAQTGAALQGAAVKLTTATGIQVVQISDTNGKTSFTRSDLVGFDSAYTTLIGFGPQTTGIHIPSPGTYTFSVLLFNQSNSGNFIVTYSNVTINPQNPQLPLASHQLKFFLNRTDSRPYQYAFFKATPQGQYVMKGSAAPWQVNDGATITTLYPAVAATSADIGSYMLAAFTTTAIPNVVATDTFVICPDSNFPTSCPAFVPVSGTVNGTLLTQIAANPSLIGTPAANAPQAANTTVSSLIVTFAHGMWDSNVAGGLMPNCVVLLIAAMALAITKMMVFDSGNFASGRQSFFGRRRE